MRIVGIVSEYNPFHNGHEYHIRQTRKEAGEDCAIVCVMSGNFVQRGEPAVFSKYARAEAAVRCGADLVFELPLPWTLSSAESFARGAVGLLGATGVVDMLSFGSESGDISALSALAEALIDPQIVAMIREEAASAASNFAVIRQTVLQRALGDSAKLLERPNDILAVEYLKAIYEQRLEMQPLAVLRTGSLHDQKRIANAAYRSAAELRGMLSIGDDAYSQMPRAAAKVFLNESHCGRGPVQLSQLELGLLARLRMLPEESFLTLPDEGDGLGSRLRGAIVTEPTLAEAYSAAKTKRFTLARIRRMTMCAALGIRSGMADGTPPYARLLAATQKGREVLRLASERAAIPILTKPAAVKELGKAEQDLFRLECDADDFYVLGYSAREERRGGSNWRSSPVIVP